MKKFLLLTVAFIALLSLSCTKLPEKDTIDVESLNFTNTVLFDGRTYFISEIDITIGDDGLENGFGEDVFYIEGQAKISLIETGVVTMYEGYRIIKSDYNMIAFSLAIPISNCSKIYDLKAPYTYGAIIAGYGTCEKTEIRYDDGSEFENESCNMVTSFYEKTIFGENSGISINDEYRGLEKPKLAKYYISFHNSHSHNKFDLYVVFNDANGQEYVISYRTKK